MRNSPNSPSPPPALPWPASGIDYARRQANAAANPLDRFQWLCIQAACEAIAARAASPLPEDLSPLPLGREAVASPEGPGVRAKLNQPVSILNS